MGIWSIGGKRKQSHNSNQRLSVLWIRLNLLYLVVFWVKRKFKPLLKIKTVFKLHGSCFELDCELYFDFAMKFFNFKFKTNPILLVNSGEWDSDLR